MKKRIVALILALLAVLSVSCNKETLPNADSTEKNEGIGETAESTSPKGTSEESTSDESDSESEDHDMKNKISAVYPKDGEKLVLANSEVYDWYKDYHMTRTDSEPYYRHEDIYYPVPVAFEWSCEGEYDSFRVYIEQIGGSGFSESYIVNGTSLSINHLFASGEYTWRVEAMLNGEVKAENSFGFKTADSPRALYIEGVSNTRDAGGMKTRDGGRIKQGMVYRGGKLDDITEDGKEYFLDIIGLKTDLDLRTPGEGGAGKDSPLGDRVNYVNINGRYYTGSMGISNEEGKQVFAEEIRLFADPDNYPIYIHCSLGRDRTGTLVMVLQGLLGAEINDMMMDYELSVFSVTGTLDNASIEGIRNNIRSTYTYIAGYEGEDFSEKTENYLLDIGITPEEIESIKSLLSEEGK